MLNLDVVFRLLWTFLLSWPLAAIADDTAGSALVQGGKGASQAPNDLAATRSSVTSSGSIDIQATLGFSNVFKPGHWTPVTVTVSNSGNDLIGYLEVLTTAGDELKGRQHSLSHRRQLELGRGSRKRFRFTVFLESLSQPLIIRAVSGGRELARHAIELRHRFTVAAVILVLSRDANLDYLNDSAGERVRVFYPLPELLPDQWQGYDAVAALVVHRVSLESLSTRQFDALKIWLARGGVLAVSGGPDFSLLRTPRLAELLPGIPEGTALIDDAGSLGSAYGSTLNVSAPFQVNRLSRFRGRVLAKSGDVPLLVEQRRGAGRVLYLTFDVARQPFDRWLGMKPLWQSILAITPPEPLSLENLAAERPSPLSEIIRGQSTAVPERVTVLLFLALYLGILATGYRLPSAGSASRWLRSATTFAAPLIFLPAAYYAFGPAFYRHAANAIVIAVIEPLAHTPYAQLRLDVAMYSSRNQPLLLAFQGAEPTFRAAFDAASQAPVTNWVFNEDEPRSLQPDTRDKYKLHVLEGQAVITDDLQASVEHTEQGVNLRVRNQDGRALRDSWLVFDGGAYAVGAIEVGAEIERAFNSATDALPVDSGRWWRQLSAHAGVPETARRATQAILDRRRQRLEMETYPEAGQAVLIGFSANPLRLKEGSAEWHLNELALVLFDLPVAAPIDES